MKDKVTPFYLMNGFRSPRLNKLVPLSAFLPRRPNVDTDYLRSFIKLREALWLISYNRRKLNEQKDRPIGSFQSQLKVGDLVALVRKRPLGARAGHKLQPKVMPGIYKVCRLTTERQSLFKIAKPWCSIKILNNGGALIAPST